MPQVIGQAAAAALIAVGVPGGVAVTAGTAIGQAVFYTAITLGLTAVTKAQLPSPEAGHLSLKTSRPQRTVLVGGPSRLTKAWEISQ